MNKIALTVRLSDKEYKIIKQYMLFNNIRSFNSFVIYLLKKEIKF